MKHKRKTLKKIKSISDVSLGDILTKSGNFIKVLAVNYKRNIAYGVSVKPEAPEEPISENEYMFLINLDCGEYEKAMP